MRHLPVCAEKEHTQRMKRYYESASNASKATFSNNNRLRKFKNEITVNFNAKCKGQPMPYPMPRAEFLAQRYCHSKGEVNLTIATLLARMGIIDLYNVKPIQKNAGSDNSIRLLKNDIQAT